MRTWRQVAAWAIAAAVVVVLAALATHHECVDPGPPVSKPSPSTSRATYCDALAGSTRWVVLVVLPILVVVALLIAFRRHPRILAMLSILVIMAAVANAVVVGSLEFVPPSP